MLNDIRLAVRTLVRDRWLSLAAIIALALGIAVNTTIFTIVNAAMLRDLPIDGADRMLALSTQNVAARRRAPTSLSYMEFEEWRRAVRTFDGMAGYLEFDMTVADDVTPPARYEGSYISGNGFELIGARPILGRGFRAGDDLPGAEPVVVLGHAAWAVRFGADPAIVGRVIRVNGVPATVIGVMPERFGFPQVAGIWRPLGQVPDEVRNNRTMRAIVGVARMRTGITIDQATAELGVIAASLARQYPDSNGGVVPRAIPFREEALSSRGRLMLQTLLVAVGFVLLIACANVSNLLLARALARAREMSLRLSIGATRWHVVRQMLAESALLAGAAATGGLALSVVGTRAFEQSLEGQGAPYWLDVTLDGRVFAYVAILCLGTALAFGLVPALQASQTDISGALNDSGRGQTASRRSRRWTGAFVVVQMALTLVLLAGATFSTHDLVAQLRTDVGVDTSGLTIAQLNLPASSYPDAGNRARFYANLGDRLSRGTGVRATFASAWPRGGGFTTEIEIDGQPNAPPDQRPRATRMAIGPAYFDVLGSRVVRGRDFTDTDRGGVAIVNERFAAMHFGSREVIGRRISLGSSPDGPADQWLTIVGVAANVRQRLLEGDRGFDPVVYEPYAASPLPFATLLARGSGTGAAAAALRDQVSAIDRDLPLSSVSALEDELSRDRWEVKFLSVAFGIFAVIGIVLASVGLYGVTAYAVSQRTREIGIRIALGAQARQLWWLVTRRASWQVLLGLLIGMPGVWAVALVLEGGLEAVSATDPLTIAGVPLLLAAVAVIACVVPARRAMRLNPVEALRSE